ncbi:MULTISPECIES: hypothetical protein [unclassified Streptomyces]|uniref:hypothetical protein n=1 Tax=unclassified Streptomyces TaxID=2593676 RepID=UPI00081ED3D9|nr:MULTISPECIES: hypothetical protein [unclassified Streptomyces]MYR30528.1 hypothetical protein [Streptomyces sp. SID4945]SCF50040.1 hypothetical protein GA0115257_12374 [Streptomyces sp. LcepLS]
MTQLDQIAAHGNAPSPKTGERPTPNRIRCADGFSLSVIAGAGYYCQPRPALLPGLPSGLAHGAPADYPGPYTQVEVGFPSERPEPWSDWAEHVEDPDEPTRTVYSYVPVEIVRALIDSHGGEVAP